MRAGMAEGVFVGLSTIDMNYAVDSFPGPNTKVVAHSQELIVGGPAANAAITFSHLGKSAALVTAIGRGKLASLIKDELDRYSINLIDIAPDYDGLPPLSSITVDRQGSRSIVSVNTGTIANSYPSVDANALSTARILLVDGHFVDACVMWARAAHRGGIPVVLDGGSWKFGTEQLLESVDIAICSADFTPPGCTNENEAIAYLKAHNVAQIAITHGADPIRFVSGSSLGAIPVPQTEAVDTTGAGDIFHGAFCYFFSSGKGFVDSLREAAVIASNSCRYAGTRRWMQSR